MSEPSDRTDPSEPKPYIPADTPLADWSWKGLVLGLVFGAVLGSANAYLGLKVGLTISTSIPLAVMALALFKVVGRIFHPTNILECNIAQTGGKTHHRIQRGAHVVGNGGHKVVFEPVELLDFKIVLQRHNTAVFRDGCHAQLPAGSILQGELVGE